MNINLIHQINNDLIELSYTHHGNRKKFNRIIAVDSSWINVNKDLLKDGFILSKNKSYCKCRIGSLFDVETRTPINYLLSVSSNEREILIEQLKYINEGDILIMDRGYYSKKLLVFV